MAEELVKVRILVEDDEVRSESLWAVPVGAELYQLRNIPFIAEGYAEGDLVRCRQQDGWPEVQGIARDSGNATLRLLLTDRNSSAGQQVLNQLVALGCTYEAASARLVGVTVPRSLPVSFLELSEYLNAVPDEILPGWEVAKWPQDAPSQPP